MTRRYYSEALSQELARRYQQLRQRAELLAEQKKQKTYSNFPELQELRQRLQSALWARTKQRCLDLATSERQSAVVKPTDTAVLLSEPQAVADDPEKIRQQIRNFLDSNHIPRDFDQPQYNCILCGDTGQLSDGRECICRRKHLRQIQQQRNWMLPPLDHRFMEHIPELFSSECSANCYDGKISQREVFGLAKQQAEAYTAIFTESGERIGQKNIYICGPTGTGKSFLLGAVANELVEQGFTVIYLSAAELSVLFQKRQRLMKEYRPSDEEVNLLNDVFDELLSCEFLAIDDLGAEPTDNSFTNNLARLADQREEAGKNTGVSTNLLPSDLQRHYSERLSSRLVNTSTMIMLDGEDIREKALEYRLVKNRGFK